jgi:tRNA (cytidine/uridine-2'-O-)-methyltransferase
MDYWHRLDVHHHDGWPSFRSSAARPRRLWLFTTHGTRGLWETTFEPGDGLVFGNEGEGAPAWLHEEVGEDARVRIPHLREGFRSLNLSTSVGVAVYEALRQLASRGLVVSR